WWVQYSLRGDFHACGRYRARVPAWWDRVLVSFGDPAGWAGVPDPTKRPPEGAGGLRVHGVNALADNQGAGVRHEPYCGTHARRLPPVGPPGGIRCALWRRWSAWT